MAPKKQKAVKQSLSEFLSSDIGGSGDWADDEIDYSSISVPVQQQQRSSGFDSGFQSSSSNFDSQSSRQRTEYPVPDAPPYSGRINNLPWDVNEEDISQWLEDLVGPSSFSKLIAPKDNGQLKGYAFITFNTREALVKALDISGTELNGRKVYIAVAAPDSKGGRPPREDFDWNRRGPLQGAPEGDFQRGGPRGPRRESREEPNLDWGTRRGPLQGAPEGEFQRSAPRRERKEEPDLDWGTRRGPLSGPPAEGEFQRSGPRREPRRERKEEPDLDWGTRRGPLSGPVLGEGLSPRGSNRGPKKERKEEPELNWSVRRGPLTGPAAVEHSSPKSVTKGPRKERKEEPELDWSVRKGPLTGPPKKDNFDWSQAKSKVAPKATTPKPMENTTKAETAKPKGSMYGVLAVDSDEDDEELAEKTEKLNI